MQKKAEEKKKDIKKYTVKPPKDLRSKFELKQAAKAEAEQEAEAAKRKAEEEERQAVSLSRVRDFFCNCGKGPRAFQIGKISTVNS